MYDTQAYECTPTTAKQTTKTVHPKLHLKTISSVLSLSLGTVGMVVGGGDLMLHVQFDKCKQLDCIAKKLLKISR